jgi:predicted N-acyltransferase
MQYKWLNSIEDLKKEQWNSLAKQQFSPFLEWEWLYCLEKSGSVSPQTGWTPKHLSVWKENTLVAVAPLYIRTDSWGDFVYDFMWADVAKQIGFPYYPKLVGAVPATPAPGYKFLIENSYNETELSLEILEFIKSELPSLGIANLQFNFVEKNWSQILPKEHIEWSHHYYEWERNESSNFNDYLGRFRKNQRRNIKRETQSYAEQGFVSEFISGDEISDQDLEHMYYLYSKTNDQFGPWAARFVNHNFFKLLFHEFRHRLVLEKTSHPDIPVESGSPLAMAFMVRKDQYMYGRYWGTWKDFDNLHFNVCYYQPIQWAIEHGVDFFDPGAGSPHKVRRGFKVKEQSSYHYFSDPMMKKLFLANIPNINSWEEDQRRSIMSSWPLKEAVEDIS